MYSAHFHLQYPQLRWPRARHWTPNCSPGAPLLAAVCMHSAHLYLLVWRNCLLSALQWKLIPCLLKISTKGSMYIQKTRGLRQSLAPHHLFFHWGTLTLCCAVLGVPGHRWSAAGHVSEPPEDCEGEGTETYGVPAWSWTCRPRVPEDEPHQIWHASWAR